MFYKKQLLYVINLSLTGRSFKCHCARALSGKVHIRSDELRIANLAKRSSNFQLYNINADFQMWFCPISPIASLSCVLSGLIRLFPMDLTLEKGPLLDLTLAGPLKKGFSAPHNFRFQPHINKFIAGFWIGIR